MTTFNTFLEQIKQNHSELIDQVRYFIHNKIIESSDDISRQDSLELITQIKSANDTLMQMIYESFMYINDMQPIELTVYDIIEITENIRQIHKMSCILRNDREKARFDMYVDNMIEYLKKNDISDLIEQEGNIRIVSVYRILSQKHYNDARKLSRMGKFVLQHLKSLENYNDHNWSYVTFNVTINGTIKTRQSIKYTTGDLPYLTIAVALFLVINEPE